MPSRYPSPPRHSREAPPTRPSRHAPSPPNILQALLSAHRVGRVPFLIRTLKYVKDHKKSAHERLWDMSWVAPKSRDHTLRIEFSPIRISPQRAVQEGAALRLSLEAYLPDGRNQALTAPETALDLSRLQGSELADPISFDLSALHGLLPCPATSISISASLRSPATAALSGTSELWRSEDGPAVANRIVIISLRPRGTTSGVAPPVELRLRAVGRLALQPTEPARPPVIITVTYTAPNLPSWRVTRHDFNCPWCHRNCHRFRTLLTHFQFEHDELKFALHQNNASIADGATDAAGNPADSVGFSVQLDVALAGDPAAPTVLPSERKETFEEEFIHPVRYPGPRIAEAVRRRLAAAKLDDGAEADVEGDANADDDTSSDMDDDDAPANAQYLSVIRDRLWSYCSHCARRHDRSYNGRTDFCSEWCELSRRAQRPGGDSRPMAEHASVPRTPRVDFARVFNGVQLFHVVSMAPIRPSHVEDDDPDSEEEVDQSWRLQLALERVRGLEGITAKERVLMSLWNTFAFENEPIPSMYGERYTRYTLELFALECGERIRTLGLRLQLLGFLRALHVHGLIDSKGILSVMLCLDGKKKRRDLALSRRPEAPVELNGRIRGSGRGRRGRRRNQT